MSTNAHHAVATRFIDVRPDDDGDLRLVDADLRLSDEPSTIRAVPARAMTRPVLIPTDHRNRIAVLAVVAGAAAAAVAVALPLLAVPFAAVALAAGFRGIGAAHYLSGRRRGIATIGAVTGLLALVLAAVTLVAKPG